MKAEDIATPAPVPATTQPAMRTASTEAGSTASVIVLGLLGAYVNAASYGFAFGAGNHEFDLPLLNWLRDPSLYPHDPITEAFAHFPTVFWPLIAKLSNGANSKTVLLVLFLLTKLIFFTALARIIGTRVKDRLFAACMVLVVALSPFLNDLTPLGNSDVLNSAQTHASLAVALLLWVGCFLLEEKWLPASILAAATIYIDAVFFVPTLSSVALFTLRDWRRSKISIFLSGLLGAAISLPWLLFWSGMAHTQYPNGYVEALLAFFPLHLRLSNHEPYDLISGAGVIFAAAAMAWVARKSSAGRDTRLELLAFSFFIPVAIGAACGEFFLTPTLARLQLLRADSFLMLYAMLLVQVYGSNLLRTSHRGAAATFFLADLAILLPLSDLAGLIWPLYLAVLLWAWPVMKFDELWRAASRSRAIRIAGLSTVLVGITAAGLPHADWSSTVVILLAILAGCFFVYGQGYVASENRSRRVTAAVSTAALLMVGAGTLPQLSSLWNFAVPLGPQQQDWRAVQRWALENSPRDAHFLVPTYPGGFREFSERSSWGEWKDGQAMYHAPALADVYHRRMTAIGYPWGEWRGTGAVVETYRKLSWDKLLQIARENRLNYIIEFRDMSSPIPPVYANDTYAVYKVSP